MNPICPSNQRPPVIEDNEATPGAKNKAINLRYLEAMSGSNVEFVSAMLNAFRDESTIFLLDMEEHLATRDFLSIQLASHKMKPTGVYIGSNYFSLLMDLLENAALRVNEERVISLFGQIKLFIQSIRYEIDEYFTATRLSQAQG